MPNSSHERSYEVRRPAGADNPGRIFNLPGIVTAIFLINILVFASMLFVPRLVFPLIESVGAVSPERFAQGAESPGGLFGAFLPLFTHMFVHASFAHIGLNSMFFLAFGTPIARRMRTENALKASSAFARAFLFVVFYGLCGVAGALAYIALHLNEPTLLVGASGGIFGLWGAVARLGSPRTSLLGPEYARISSLASSTVITWTLFVVISNLAIGVFGDRFTGGGANVAWEAHIGGYLFGLLFYPAFDRTARLIK